MINEQLRPAGIDQVQRMLTVLAATMQCKMPPQEALLKYFDILKEYPVDLLDFAMNEYLRKSTYQKFPLIAELTTEMDEQMQLRRSEKKHIRETQLSYRFPVSPTIAPGEPTKRQVGGPRQIGISLPQQPVGDHKADNQD